MASSSSSRLKSSKLIAAERGEGEFDDVVSDHAQYGRVQFWDMRYANEHEPFEWYYPYDYFRSTIRDCVPLSWKVLVAGCGSSNMVGDLVADGYERVTGLDISRVAIAQLKYRYKDYQEIDLINANMTDTDLPEGSYGAIVDKALFDSLLCSQTTTTTIAQYLFEVERLLDDEGVFIIISHGTPEQRLPMLEQYDIEEPHFTPWVVEVQALLKPRDHPEEVLNPQDPASMYFIYVCKKTRELVLKKKVSLGRAKKKEMRLLQPTKRKEEGRRVNLKPVT